MGQRLIHEASSYHTQRVVCLTLVPPYSQAEYCLDPKIESKLTKLVDDLGKNCRMSKFQWLVATAEPCKAIVQDLDHEGVGNVIVFSLLAGDDWQFRCKPAGPTDESEFDGVAAFLQQLG